ncbi:Fic family protein [Patescibacteria group bacterium]|nr:Fic family protein [Patescibacteria group bacterium]
MSKNALAELYAEIDSLKDKIAGRRPFPDDLNSTIQERLRIEWTYNSNAIEGNTLTFGETAFFLREGLTSEGKPLKDYLEAKNHAEAIDGLYEIILHKRRITESLIKELHAVLMKDMHFTVARNEKGAQVKKPLHAGKYKIMPNHVLTLSGKIHYYTDPLQVPGEMEKLVAWLAGGKEIHPVEKAAIFHYRFVSIHPFDDGNGRLARLLMNLILMQSGYSPCIIMNAHRREYLTNLEKVDTAKDYASFIFFIGKELKKTLQTVFDIICGEKDIGTYMEKRQVLNSDERETLILEIISATPVSVSQIMQKIPRIKRPTIKKDLKRLLKENKIMKKGVGKGTVYYS